MNTSHNSNQEKSALFQVLERFLRDLRPYLNKEELMKANIDDIVKRILDPLSDFAGVKIKRFEMSKISYDWLSRGDVTQKEILESEMIPIERLNSVQREMDIYLELVIEYESIEAQFLCTLTIDKDATIECRGFTLESINKADDSTLRELSEKPSRIPPTIREIIEYAKKFVIETIIIVIEKVLQNM